MSLPEWPVDKTLGKKVCETKRQTWQCPNMLRIENDMDLEYENYYCSMCNKSISLDYDEMR